jgi:hypothetical protein
LDQVIRPAFEPLGYQVERADHDATPGIITEAIVSRLISADLVIAELSGQNPNVMYELAIRHAFGKPVIMMLEHGQELPFDIGAQNAVFYSADLAGRDEAIAKLLAAHGQVDSPGASGNPVRRTLDVMAMRQDASDKDTLFLDLLVQLRRDVATIRERVAGSATEAIPEALAAVSINEDQWDPLVLRSMTPEEKYRFIRTQLFPAVRNRAYREWENLAYGNMDGKVQERTIELGEGYARTLGLIDAWRSFLRENGG